MVHLAGSSKLLRAMNSAAALALLLERGRLTRGELRSATGLSKPTVSDALRRLVEADLAVVVGHVSGGPGPNAEVYAINPDAAYAATVSIGTLGQNPADPGAPASVVAALCDLTGTIRASRASTVDLRAAAPVDVIADTVAGLVTDAAVDPARLGQVQIGVAGAYDRASQTVHHIDLPGFDRPDLVPSLGRRLATGVDVDNDVNLAALAERRHGCANGVDGFALLWLGDGLGLAIDLGGSLLRGARGGAGEIGYLRLGPAELQDQLGGPAVAALAAGYGYRAATAAEAVGAARDDPAFLAALAERVATAVGVVVAVLDPGLVVLAGPVARAGGTALRDAVVAATGRSRLPDTAIDVTRLDGDPVVLGGLDAAMAAVHTQLRGRIEPEHAAATG